MKFEIFILKHNNNNVLQNKLCFMEIHLITFQSKMHNIPILSFSQTNNPLITHSLFLSLYKIKNCSFITIDGTWIT